MKKIILSLCLICPAFSSFGEVNTDQLSETLGHLIVRHLIHPGFNFNLDKVVEGIQNERANQPSPMTEEEYEGAICALEEEHFRLSADKNLSEAEAFLQKNARSEEIHVVNEKLQYAINQEGNGSVVKADSIPLIYYKGCLIDGTKFASAEKSEGPVSLPMSQAIAGFAQGLLGMKEGEKRTIYIHPELAYGVTGELPPNSLLIFEVEVVKSNSTDDPALTALFGSPQGN